MFSTFVFINLDETFQNTLVISDPMADSTHAVNGSLTSSCPFLRTLVFFGHLDTRTLWSQQFVDTAALLPSPGYTRDNRSDSHRSHCWLTAARPKNPLKINE